MKLYACTARISGCRERVEQIPVECHARKLSRYLFRIYTNERRVKAGRNEFFSEHLCIPAPKWEKGCEISRSKQSLPILSNVGKIQVTKGNVARLGNYLSYIV